MSISNNTTKLQSLLGKINALPEVENLDKTISEQDSLISQIKETVNNLPDAGSGGNSEVATCTIEIINETFGKALESYIDGLCFISYENGEYKTYFGVSGSKNNIIPDGFDWMAEKNILNNVVCNSIMYLQDINGCVEPPSYNWYINQGLDNRFLFIQSTPNVTHTIKLSAPF